MRKIDCLIFDMDGTIVDTRLLTTKCVNYALTQIGESPVDGQTVTEAIGSSLVDTFRAILPTSKWSYIDQCVRQYVIYQRTHHVESLRNVNLYPTVRETLDQISSCNLALATNKPAWLANKILTLVGIKQYFFTIVGAEDVPKSKPSPDMIHLVISRINSFGGAMIVGDSVEDIQAGHSAHILTCAVEYGYTPKEKLMEAKPTFSIYRFCDLLTILEHLSQPT